MPKIACAVWLIVASMSFATVSDAAPRLEWQFHVKMDKDEQQPRGRVDLAVGERQIVHVEPHADSVYRVVPREEFASNHIPAGALIACASWWAGSGTTFYVTSAGTGKPALYRKDADEGAPLSGFKRVRTIRVE